MERRLLLDVVIGQRPAVLELLAGEDQPLLVRWDALLVLDLGIDVLDRVRSFDLQRDGLAGQRLDEDLHPVPQPQHQVEGRLLWYDFSIYRQNTFLCVFWMQSDSGCHCLLLENVRKSE